jgi:NADPH-dependent 2,4-dienoyl-CoA reductase/sulfur reductase-like enzyme
VKRRGNRRRPPAGVRRDRVVIVGAGRAGVAAAEELRIQGFEGDLTILCDEKDAPYDRPACSKKILTGHARPRDIRLPVRGGTDARWRLGRRAIGLDAVSRIVYTDTDEEFHYDGLVIATGSRPSPPNNWPIGEPGLHVLHSLSEAWALREDLRDAERVAIVGGGLTGCEAAWAIRSMARDCVLIDSNPQVMTRALGDLVGRLVTAELHREGVYLRLGRRVSQLRPRRRGWLLVLDDGEEIEADVVVATIGDRPDTKWLANTDIDISDGVLCDESLRVLGADGIVAAGTVARWPNLRFSTTPRRCGQWIAALEQGRAAAQTLMHGGQWVPPVTLLPRFWSEQFGLRIQVCGDQPKDAVVTVTEMRPGRRDIARAGVLVSYTVEGRLVGVVSVNAAKAFTAMTRALMINNHQIEQPMPMSPAIPMAPPFAPAAASMSGIPMSPPMSPMAPPMSPAMAPHMAPHMYPPMSGAPMSPGPTAPPVPGPPEPGGRRRGHLRVVA